MGQLSILGFIAIGGAFGACSRYLISELCVVMPRHARARMQRSFTPWTQIGNFPAALRTWPLTAQDDNRT